MKPSKLNLNNKLISALITLCFLMESAGLNCLSSAAYADKDVLRPIAMAVSPHRGGGLYSKKASPVGPFSISPEVVERVNQLTAEQKKQFAVIRRTLVEKGIVEIDNPYFSPYRDLIIDMLACSMAFAGYIPQDKDRLTFSLDMTKPGVVHMESPEISHAVIYFERGMMENDLEKLIQTVDTHLEEIEEDWADLLREISKTEDIAEVRRRLKEFDLTETQITDLIGILRLERGRGLILPKLKSKKILTVRGCILRVLASEIAHAVETLWKNRYGRLDTLQKFSYFNRGEKRKEFERQGYRLTNYPALLSQYTLAEAIDILWQIIYDQAYEFANVTCDYPEMTSIFFDDFYLATEVDLTLARHFAYEQVVETIKAKVAEWVRNRYIKPDPAEITHILNRFTQYIIFTDLEFSDEDIEEIHAFSAARAIYGRLIVAVGIKVTGRLFEEVSRLGGKATDSEKIYENVKSDIQRLIAQFAGILTEYPELFSSLPDKEMREELGAHLKDKEKKFVKKAYLQRFLKEIIGFETPAGFLSALADRIDEAMDNARRVRTEDFAVIELLEKLRTEVVEEKAKSSSAGNNKGINETEFTLNSAIDLRNRKEFLGRLYAFAYGVYYQFSSAYELGISPQKALERARKKKDETNIAGEKEIISLGEFKDWDNCIEVISYLITGEFVSENELIKRLERRDKRMVYDATKMAQILFLVISLSKEKGGLFSFKDLWLELNKVLKESQQILDNLQVSAEVKLKDGTSVTIGPDHVEKLPVERLPDLYGPLISRALNLALGNICLSQDGARSADRVTDTNPIKPITAISSAA